MAEKKTTFKKEAPKKLADTTGTISKAVDGYWASLTRTSPKEHSCWQKGPFKTERAAELALDALSAKHG